MELNTNTHSSANETLASNGFRHRFRSGGRGNEDIEFTVMFYVNMNSLTHSLIEVPTLSQMFHRS